jgi:16S rRNA (uracil1498-N3)-methyltransferase
MHHFFLSPELLQTETITFPPDIARQMARVLRLSPGDRVVALDGLGSAHTVELVQVEREGVHGQVVAVHPAGGEAAARITLYLALTGREKFEWMLQKCTEVGAAAFVPVISSRSLVQDGRDAAKKLERWERIVREAAEQSRRGILPPVHLPLAFGAALQRAQPDALRLIPWEGEHSLTLRAALAPFKAAPAPTIAVFIGPEGGFSEAEIEAARAAGVQPVTLGERILRMETAAVVAAALVLYELSAAP